MTRVLATLLALALFVPASAGAQGPTNAPPGNSAIEQYLETVPSASGNDVPRPPGGTDVTLTPVERARLEELGADGRALANVVESTAPARDGDRSSAGAVGLPDTASRSPLSEVLGVVEGDGGMGMLLPAILLGSLLSAIALVLLRRRSAS